MKNFGVKKVCEKMNGFSEIFLSVEWSSFSIIVRKKVQTGKAGMSKGIETQTYRHIDRRTYRQTD